MMLRFVLTAAALIPIVSPLTEDKLLKSQINDAKNAAAFNRLLSHIANVNEERLVSIKKLVNLQVQDKLLKRLLSHIANVNEERLVSIKKLVNLQSVNPYPDFADSLRTDVDRDDDDSDSSESDKSSVVYLVIPDTTALKPENPQINNVSKNNVVPPAPILQQPMPPPISPESNIDTNIKKNIEPVHARSDVIEPLPTTLREKKKHKKNAKEKESEKDEKEDENESVNVTLNNDGWNFLRQSILRSCKSKEIKKCRKACKEAVGDACETFECRKKLKKSLKKNCKKKCKAEFNSDW